MDLQDLEAREITIQKEIIRRAELQKLYRKYCNSLHDALVNYNENKTTENYLEAKREFFKVKSQPGIEKCFPVLKNGDLMVEVSIKNVL